MISQLALALTLTLAQKDAVEQATKDIERSPRDADAYHRRGAAYFKLGDAAASARDFDKEVELKPERKVSHWQRGISYYYAGRYDEGRAQFEGYQDFDKNDVENALWQFMCVARKDGLDKARKALLPIGADRRVPMRQVYDLFAGKLQPDDVLAAARADEPARQKQQLFYAHLYVGIYYDLLGKKQPALEQLDRAVANRIDHYMGDVARVQRDRLRAELK